MISEETALNIEDLKDRLRYPLSFCRLAKHTGILDESRRECITKIHIILPSDFQIYHVEGLEKHCHYTIRINHIQEFQMISRRFGLKTQVYSSEISHNTDFITIRNSVSTISGVMKEIYLAMPKAKGLLLKRNSNYSVTYGYSDGYSGRNREAGGPPILASCGIESTKSKTLLPLLLHMLCELTADRVEHREIRQIVDAQRTNLFAKRMGQHFGFKLKRHNIFEGVDCSMRVVGLHSESLLAPHCDGMNDW